MRFEVVGVDSEVIDPDLKQSTLKQSTTALDGDFNGGQASIDRKQLDEGVEHFCTRHIVKKVTKHGLD